MRTLEATEFNAIANHPEVRPWLGFEDVTRAIDLTEQVANPNNFAFLTPQKDGGYILLKLQPGLYAAHSLAMPAARGRPMLRLMREGFLTMFTATDAVEIVTQIPDGNDGAAGWSRLAGFRQTFRREGFFPLMGERVGCQFASLTYADWAIAEKSNLILGEQFHHLLKSYGLADHIEDKAHDAFVGATIASIQRQNVVKAVALYNRFAALSGYHQAQVLSITPPVVDTGDAILGTLNGGVEVLQVKVTRSAIPES